MKNTNLFIAALLICTVALIVPAHAQAFKKGSLLIGLSEGSTHSVYSTGDDNPIQPIHTEPIHGVRDPLSLEYGLSNRLGIGITSGNDIFLVNPYKFYGADVSAAQMKANTSEFTIDLSYHFYVSKRNDLSLTTSFGSASVSMKGVTGDSKYQYLANGNILRFGLHARHYFCKRFGVLGMLTAYSSNCTTKDVQGNTFGNNYSTGIKG